MKGKIGKYIGNFGRAAALTAAGLGLLQACTTTRANSYYVTGGAADMHNEMLVRVYGGRVTGTMSTLVPDGFTFGISTPEEAKLHEEIDINGDHVITGSEMRLHMRGTYGKD